MRLLSLCPRIHKNGDRLHATTAWRFAILTLGAMYRNVVVDPKARTVSVATRYLWTIPRSRTIPFSNIEAVTYGYEDMAINASFTAHDGWDCFTVGLRLVDDSEFRLFHFLGEGTFVNNGRWPDWMHWDEYMFDLSGSQEKESRAFVELLAKMIDVSVVPPRDY